MLMEKLMHQGNSWAIEPLDANRRPNPDLVSAGSSAVRCGA